MLVFFSFLSFFFRRNTSPLHSDYHLVLSFPPGAFFNRARISVIFDILIVFHGPYVFHLALLLQTGGSIEKTAATIAEEGRDLSVFVFFFFVGLLKSETINLFFGKMKIFFLNIANCRNFAQRFMRANRKKPNQQTNKTKRNNLGNFKSDLEAQIVKLALSGA